jgi:hypothetical protein
MLTKAIIGTILQQVSSLNNTKALTSYYILV